jgi:hypothetical protein
MDVKKSIDAIVGSKRKREKFRVYMICFLGFFFSVDVMHHSSGERSIAGRCPRAGDTAS